MSDLSLEILDPSHETDREAYERAFYSAFQRAAGNRLIRQLWVFDDDNRRLATRIPYDDQIIYAFRDNERRIVTAMGVNIAMRELQGAAFGFRVADSAGCCEFLTLFSLDEYRLQTRFQFQLDCFADLYKRGFHTACATTARRILRAYLRLGAQVLAEKEIEGEMRYFLKFDLQGTPQR